MKYFKFPTILSLHSLKKIYNELIDGFSDRNLSNLIVNGNLKFRVKRNSDECLYKWFLKTTSGNGDNIVGVGIKTSTTEMSFINLGSGNFCAKLCKDDVVKILYQMINLPKDVLENGQVTVSLQYRFRDAGGNILSGLGQATISLSDYGAHEDLTEESFNAASNINTLQKVFDVPVGAESLQAELKISVSDNFKNNYLEIVNVTASSGKLSATSLLKQRDNALDCVKYQNGSWQLTNDATRYFKINGLNKQFILVGTNGIEENGGSITTIQDLITEFGQNKVYVLTSNITLGNNLTLPVNSVLLGNGYTVICAGYDVILSNSCSLRNVNFSGVHSFTVSGTDISMESCHILSLTNPASPPIGLLLNGAERVKISDCSIIEKLRMVNAKDCYVENLKISVANSTTEKNFLNLSGSLRNFISFHAILSNVSSTIYITVCKLEEASLNNTINLISYRTSSNEAIPDEEITSEEF